MQYIYICPRCLKTYVLKQKDDAVCDECDVYLVGTDKTQEQWDALSNQERSELICKVDKAGSIGVTKASLIEDYISTLYKDSYNRGSFYSVRSKAVDICNVILGVSTLSAIFFGISKIGRTDQGFIIFFVSVIVMFLSLGITKLFDLDFFSYKTNQLVIDTKRRCESNINACYRRQINALGYKDAIELRSADSRFIDTVLWCAEESIYISLGKNKYENTICKEEITMRKWDLPYTKIAYCDLLYFAKRGDLFYYDKVVSGTGGYKFSLGGAIIGELLAGAAGFYLMGIKKDPIVTETRTIDSRKTIIMYRANDEIKSLEYNGHDAYVYLSSRIPEKRLELIQV